MPLREKLLYAYKVIANQELAALLGISYRRMEQRLDQQAIALMAVHKANFRG